MPTTFLFECLNCKEQKVLPVKRGPLKKFCSGKCRQQFRYGHKPRLSLEQRVASKISAPNKKGCRDWKGAKNEDGYGILGVDGSMVLAHRVVYEIQYNIEPGPMHVLHSCDNPACCEYTHLFLGTHIDNMRDRQEKGRTLRGEDAGGTKFSDDTIKNIRILIEQGKTHSQISMLTGVSLSHISYIRNNKTRVVI